MRCAACNGGVPPGKVLFCPPCFVVLPNKDQREMTSHYCRILRLEQRNSIPADHPGIKDKVAKLARKIREIRKLDSPAPTAESHPLAGYDLASADSVSVVRLNPATL